MTSLRSDQAIGRSRAAAGGEKGVGAPVAPPPPPHTPRAAAVRGPQPRDILDTLNEVLLRYDTDRFCTVALLRLLHAGGEWICTVSSGGHPLPLLRRGRAEPTPMGQPGSLLGVLDTAELHETEVTLRPGDAVVIYTDGVTEARRDNEFFGDARLRGAF